MLGVRVNVGSSPSFFYVAIGEEVEVYGLKIERYDVILVRERRSN